MKNGPGAYLCKYTANGAYQWVKTWGPLADGTDVLSLAGGALYLTGRFTQTVDFDPGDGKSEYTALAPMSYYLSRFNSNGDFSWVRVFGGDTDYSQIGARLGPQMANDPWGISMLHMFIMW